MAATKKHVEETKCHVFTVGEYQTLLDFIKEMPNCYAANSNTLIEDGTSVTTVTIAGDKNEALFCIYLLEKYRAKWTKLNEGIR